VGLCVVTMEKKIKTFFKTNRSSYNLLVYLFTVLSGSRVSYTRL
jgi:hypothetical protein